MNSFLVTISLFLSFFGCGLFERESNFDPIFKTHINDELYDISNTSDNLRTYHAGVSRIGTGDFLIISAQFYDESTFPYNETISFAIVWDKALTTYSSAADTVKYSEFNIVVNGGFYNENDGDAGISSYSTRPDDDGIITVSSEILDDGRIAIFGHFNFVVVKNQRSNQDSKRVGQDSLRVTNGEFRLLLDDRR